MVVIVFLGRHGEGFGEAGIDGLAPKLQVEVGPCSVVFVNVCVLDNDGPCAKTRLAPRKMSADPIKTGIDDLRTSEQHS